MSTHIWEDARAPRIGQVAAVIVAVVGLIAASASGSAGRGADPDVGLAIGVDAGSDPSVAGGSSPDAATPATSVPGAPSSAGGTPPGSAPATDAGAASAPAAQPGASLEMGRGVTDETITIGIGWTDAASLAAGCTALGGDCEGAEDLDPKSWAQKMVDWVNANGGLAGRRIVPLYFKLDVTKQLTAEDRAQMEQQMCAYWTEDNEVFAMIPTASHEGVILSCAQKTGTVFLSATPDEVVVDAERFQQVADVYYRPSWMLADRRDEVVVDALFDAGFFGEGAKVGLMIHDRPASRNAADRALKPALAARGIDVVSEVAYPDIVESPWTTYALKFRNDGVTHVLYGSGGSSGPVWFFSQQADSQGYRPFYGFGSDQEPSRVAGTSGDQVGPTATVVGWDPFEDSGYDKYAFPLNEADRLCHEIVGRVAAPMYCESLFFLKQALDRATALTPAGMRASVEALGDSFMSPFTYSTRFGPGRHDGASSVAILGWDSNCACFQPRTPPAFVG